MRINMPVRVRTSARLAVAALAILASFSGATREASAGGPYASYTLDAPCRFYDTRDWAPGGDRGSNRHFDQDIRGYRIQGACGVPLGAHAVMLNVTVVGGTGDGYLTVWQAGAPMPGTANINFAAGATVGNSMTVNLGPATSGAASDLVDVLFFSSITTPVGQPTGNVDVVIDVVGYLL